MHIYLVRHPPVQLPRGVCYGASDIDLTPDWETGAKTIRRKLRVPLEDGAMVYSSPLQRCLKVAESFSQPVTVDSRLKEFDFGRWELRAWDDIPRDEIDEWIGEHLEAQVPGGESHRAMLERCVSFFDDLLLESYERVVLVTHGGVIRTLLAYLLGMPVENAFRLRLSFNSVTEVRMDGEVVQIRYINR